LRRSCQRYAPRTIGTTSSRSSASGLANVT
jgi:hypothetical protein